MSDATFVFAGPSIFGTSFGASADDGINWLPPVRRGDIDSLIAEHPTPGVIGVADGTFHAYPSVSHVELREALEAGWLVYGLCSMGAIRVSEMRHMGMRPWGRVAEMFCKQRDFADDEVALVHGSEAPYAPLSEPLVHIREFCAQAQVLGWLSAGDANGVIEAMRHRWYGERTLASLRRELCQALGVPSLPNEMGAALDDFGPYRLKQADLRSFVADKPWLASTP